MQAVSLEVASLAKLWTLSLRDDCRCQFEFGSLESTTLTMCPEILTKAMLLTAVSLVLLIVLKLSKRLLILVHLYWIGQRVDLLWNKNTSIYQRRLRYDVDELLLVDDVLLNWICQRIYLLILVLLVKFICSNLNIIRLAGQVDICT